MPVQDRRCSQCLQCGNKQGVGMLYPVLVGQTRQALVIEDIPRIIDGVYALNDEADTIFGNCFLNN